MLLHRLGQARLINGRIQGQRTTLTGIGFGLG
jgi:hypothetical protein